MELNYTLSYLLSRYFSNGNFCFYLSHFYGINYTFTWVQIFSSLPTDVCSSVCSICKQTAAVVREQVKESFRMKLNFFMASTVAIGCCREFSLWYNDVVPQRGLRAVGGFIIITGTNVSPHLIPFCMTAPFFPESFNSIIVIHIMHCLYQFINTVKWLFQVAVLIQNKSQFFM